MESELEPFVEWERALAQAQEQGQAQVQDREQVGEWERALSPVWEKDQEQDWEYGVRELRECKP